MLKRNETPYGPDLEEATAEDVAGRRATTAVRRAGRVLLVLLMALVVYLWPASLGGRSSIVFVQGTSMLPTLTSDDVVLARRYVHYGVGDLVVFRIPDSQLAAQVDDRLVIHRIVGGSETTGWVTQGDNRDYVDPWFLDHDDIVGRAERKASIGPAALGVVRLALTPLVWAVGGALVMFVLVMRLMAIGDRDSAEPVEPAEPVA